MARHVGRKILIKRDTDPIAAARSKTITINSEPIDVTTADDSGFRTLLEDPATRSLDLSVEGVFEDDDLLELLADGSSPLIEALTIEFESGASITGNFRFNNFVVTGAHDDAATFTCEIQSTGSWTFTGAA